METDFRLVFVMLGLGFLMYLVIIAATGYYKALNQPKYLRLCDGNDFIDPPLLDTTEIPKGFKRKNLYYSLGINDTRDFVWYSKVEGDDYTVGDLVVLDFIDYGEICYTFGTIEEISTDKITVLRKDLGRIEYQRDDFSGIIIKTLTV